MVKNDRHKKWYECTTKYARDIKRLKILLIFERIVFGRRFSSILLSEQGDDALYYKSYISRRTISYLGSSVVNILRQLSAYAHRRGISTPYSNIYNSIVVYNRSKFDRFIYEFVLSLGSWYELEKLYDNGTLIKRLKSLKEELKKYI